MATRIINFYLAALAVDIDGISANLPKHVPKITNLTFVRLGNFKN
jgi:hypothetical protein